MKQHSPVIFGLLLAATLAVDAVAIAWYAAAVANPLSRAAILYDALISAQLAIACLWAIFTARGSLLAWVGSIAAVFVAAVPTARLDVLPFGEACGIYGSFVALLAVALWILKRTTFWQRLTGVMPTNWQFSLLHLMAAMTLVAVLIVALRRSPFVAPENDVWRFLTLLTVGDVLVVVATAIAWASNSHWLPRLAGACGASATLGVIEAICVDSGLLGNQLALSLDRNVLDFAAYATIMAVVVFAWLELTPLVPHARRAASLPPAGADAS